MLGLGGIEAKIQGCIPAILVGGTREEKRRARAVVGWSSQSAAVMPAERMDQARPSQAWFD